MVEAGAEQFRELEGAFESAAAATEHLLGEYALFVLEHEEVVASLQNYLYALKCDFRFALDSFDGKRAQKLLTDLHVLFGETQLEVNRSVIPSAQQVSGAVSKTNV